MLKILRSATSAIVLFSLSGRIDWEHIAELQAAFGAETLPIKVEMREVRRVDREVVPTLARWSAAGIELLNCPAYLHGWINKTQKDS